MAIKKLSKPNHNEVTLLVNDCLARWLEWAVHNTYLGCTPEQVATHLLINAIERREGRQ